MNNIFKVKENNKLIREIFKLNLEIPGWNLITFETKSLNVHGPKISNSLPFHIKSFENLHVFKSLMENWNDNLCNRTVCTK